MRRRRFSGSVLIWFSAIWREIAGRGERLRVWRLVFAIFLIFLNCEYAYSSIKPPTKFDNVASSESVHVRDFSFDQKFDTFPYLFEDRFCFISRHLEHRVEFNGVGISGRERYIGNGPRRVASITNVQRTVNFHIYGSSSTEIPKSSLYRAASVKRVSTRKGKGTEQNVYTIKQDIGPLYKPDSASGLPKCSEGNSECAQGTQYRSNNIEIIPAVFINANFKNLSMIVLVIFCWGMVPVCSGFCFLRFCDGRFISGCGFIFCGLFLYGISIVCLLTGCLPWQWPRCLHGNHKGCQYQHFHINNVTQKHLTNNNYRNTVIHMANALSTDKQITVISALAEGSSIRSIERITGVHRDTIMRLGVKVGKGCAAIMDTKMRDLNCKRLEMDEIWGFVGKKDRNVRMDETAQVGSVWTFCAIDAETKLVPTFKVGNRDTATANAFVQDVASRMRNRVQISTDGLRAYVEAVEKSFGSEVDFAQIVKTYGREEVSDNRRYSAPDFVSSEKKVITGRPDEKLISTSYVERLNATTRLHMRRLTRLTLAFSKKRENFEAAVALHFAYYNFVKRHNTLRCTPAMAAGVEKSFLSVADLVEASA